MRLLALHPIARALALAVTFAAGCTAREHAPAGATVEPPSGAHDRSSGAAEHHVVATFRDDGSCSATIDGRPLFSVSDSPHAGTVRNGVVNMAPAGSHVEQLWCVPGQDPVDGAPDPGARAVSVAFVLRDGAALHAGDYSVRALTADASRDPGTDQGGGLAAVAVFGAATGAGSSGAGGSGAPGVHYLEALSGRVALSRADTVIVGTVTAVARGANSM